MPYASDAQRRFFHTPTAAKKGISASTVKEFDTASRGMKLPPHAAKGHNPHKAALHGLKRAMSGKS